MSTRFGERDIRWERPISRHFQLHQGCDMLKRFTWFLLRRHVAEDFSCRFGASFVIKLITTVGYLAVGSVFFFFGWRDFSGFLPKNWKMLVFDSSNGTFPLCWAVYVWAAVCLHEEGSFCPFVIRPYSFLRDKKPTDATKELHYIMFHGHFCANIQYQRPIMQRSPPLTT